MIARKTKGFTLIELLITMSVMGVLASVVFFGINPLEQVAKANDARRKSDLAQIQRALELYYDDQGQYPPSLTFGGASLQPYLPRTPNDPKSPSQTYGYKTSGGQAYYLYASLERGGRDSNACYANGIVCLNATGVSCGSGKVCNYGVSSPNVTP